MTDLSVIRDMEDLEEAYFDGCGISSWDNAGFSNKQELEHLDLSYNKLTSAEGISEYLTYREKTAKLILRNNELTLDEKIEYESDAERRGIWLDLSNNKITSLENLPDDKNGYFRLKLYGDDIDLSDEKNLNWLYNNEIDMLYVDYSEAIRDLQMDHFGLIWIKDNPDSDEEEKLEAEYDKWIAIEK